MNESPDFSLTNNKRRPIQSLEAPWWEGLGWPRAIVQPARRNLRGRRFWRRPVRRGDAETRTEVERLAGALARPVGHVAHMHQMIK